MTIMAASAAKFWWGRELDPGVKYVYRNHAHEEWTAVTYKEINQKRKERIEDNIWRKIRNDVEITVPGYVWVFWTGGINDMFFRGWWIYIKTARRDYAINFRHERNNELVVKAMTLFPCRVVPGLENFNFWAQQFAKKYAHIGFHRDQRQGLVLCRCKIDGFDNLVDLIKTN